LPTMHTLEEIHNKLENIDRIEKFLHCSEVYRFCDAGDGTVLDTAQGLVWLKSPNCWPHRGWNDALYEISSLADGICGLTDGSQAGDWRMPSVSEMQGLITNPPTTWVYYDQIVGYRKPGAPFTYSKTGEYWTSTEAFWDSNMAYKVRLRDGTTNAIVKHAGREIYVWPVRSRY